MKKTVYSLNVNNYHPEITKITFPLIERYAKKIGADFQVISDRKFPEMPNVYEKFQIYTLAENNGDDWSLFFDADTLVHPDFWDVTVAVDKSVTISGYTSDFTPMRFKPDKYFMRDGRYIGKGNWFLVGSDWTRDLWHPLDDISPEEAVKNITVTQNEEKHGIKSAHLIDDYLVSRNIAKYGLKHVLLSQLQQNHGIPFQHLLHWYVAPDNWNVPTHDPNAGFTQNELNKIASDYGKPTHNLTIPEVKFEMIKKNAKIWGCL